MRTRDHDSFEKGKIEFGEAEMKLDIGVGALLRARIRRARERYRGLVVVRRGRVRIAP